MRPRFPAHLSLLLLLSLPASACHLRPTAGADHDRQGRTVTAEQIAESGARTAWDALRLFSGHIRVEGNRIAARGTSSIHLSSEPMVIMDGVRLAEHGVLRDVSARHVASIQLIRGPDATTHYGTGAGHGVLVIRTRSAHDETRPVGL